MADLDPGSIPFVPPTSVTLIDTTEDQLTGKPGGKPTTAFHEWMMALWSWMKANVVDLTTKVTTLIDGQDDLQAALNIEEIARVEGDDALAAQITTVEAKADQATADGQIFLAAKAAPSGAIAAYGVYLTAGGVFTGLEMLAKSGGASAIGLTASQFTFTDSGAAQQVFSYSGGVFYFNVPIVIQNASSGARMVVTNEAIRVYDASNVLRVAIGVGI